MMLLLTAACKKNFLDRFPQTSIPPDLFFNSEEDLSIYINGLLSIPDAYNGYVGDQDTDDKATTGSREIKNMMTGTPNSKNITSGWSWSRLRNINYFLQNYNKAAVSQEVKDHYAGLARYYRAVFYMDKVKRFSDVPWYSQVLNPSDTVELYKNRDPRKLVMDSVMADLEFASSNVKESVPVGTPGKWVVKLVYARIALYEGTYRKYHPELNLQNTANEFLEKAKLVADEVIASNKFGLHPNYAGLFNNADLVGNKEVLLANIYDQDLKRNGLNNSELHEYEMSPSRDLVQAYLMNDGSRFTDQPGYQNFGFVQEFQNRDPRLSQTLIPPGFMKAVNPPSVPVPYVQVLSKNFTGYHQLKGYINSTDIKTRRDVDFPAYRYAEVLLFLAEALNEQGKTAESLTYLDQVRERAGLDNSAASGQSEISDAIANERRVELAFENKRWLDLVRTGKAVSVMTAYGTYLKAHPQEYYYPAGIIAPPASFTNIKLLFELPASEAALSPYF